MTDVENPDSTPMDEGCGDDDANKSTPTYAGITGDGNYDITFKLEADKKDDYSVTYKEVAHMVYKRLDAPPWTLVKYDDTRFGKLTITLKNTAILNSLVLSHGLEIRAGLRTQPVKQQVKETKVQIFWAPFSISNQQIDAVLSTFGEVTSEVSNKVCEPKEDDDDITKMMKGVILTDRYCSMVIRYPIPSHILVEGVKVKITYYGQSRTCSRCYKYWNLCPGGGKASVCRAKAEAEKKEKEGKGEKVPKAPNMNKHWKAVTKKIEDKKKKGPNLDLDDDATGADVAPTCLRVTSLPPDVTLPELLNIMKSNHCGDIEDLGDKIMLDNSKPGTAVIKDLDKIDFELVIENIDGVFLRGKRFKVTPIQEKTPEKETEKNSQEEEGSSPVMSMGASAGTSSSSSSTPPPGASAAPTPKVNHLEKNKDDIENIDRTPPNPTAMEKLAKFFTGKENKKTKEYERVTESGRKINSSKNLRFSSSDETSPQNVRQTRQTKKKK